LSYEGECEVLAELLALPMGRLGGKWQQEIAAMPLTVSTLAALQLVKQPQARVNLHLRFKHGGS
jgi:hypothetical protein